MTERDTIVTAGRSRDPAERGPVTYPRAFVHLTATVGGREVSTGIVPSKAAVARRSHNQAGTAEVTIHGSALPFDPRQIDGIFVQVYLGAVAHVDAPVNLRQYLQFVGFVDELKESYGEKGPEVELKARDLSALYRDFKPVPPDALPRYSYDLGQAIERVIDAVPATWNRDDAGQPVSQRIGLRNAALDLALRARRLGAAAPGRTPEAPVRLPADANAWQVIEHVGGLLSVMPSVDLDAIVLRDSAQIFGHDNPVAAAFEFGGEAANLLSLERSKKFVRNRKGVRVTAYDPLTRSTLVADYPSDAELLRIHRAPSAAALGRAQVAARRAPRNPTPPERDGFTAPRGMFGDTTRLQDYARRIYEERSRQELEGRLVTPLWTDAVLALQNADRFTLTLHAALEAELQTTRSEGAALALLQRRLGVDPAAAAALLRARRARPTDAWYARTITHEFDAGGRSTTSVDFINLIELSTS